MEITELEKIKIGEKLADILMLREDKDWILPQARWFIPKRYKTTWGNKTALGLYGTIKRILEGK